MQNIFKCTPRTKQVMMFSATLKKEIRPICKKFMKDVCAPSPPPLPVPALTAAPPVQPMEIYVDDETKLTLHGLQQHYVKLAENLKNRKLTDLLDALEFNQVCLVHASACAKREILMDCTLGTQVVIFVKTVQRCVALNKLLQDCNFPSIAIHRLMSQDERCVDASPTRPLRENDDNLSAVLSD